MALSVTLGALLVFAVSAGFFGVAGTWLARALGFASPRAMGPALGWAVCAALALPVWLAVGFNRLTIAAFAASMLAASWRLARGAPRQDALPLWVPGLCAVIALLPAAAVLPHGPPDAVRLSEPMFDHVKVALTSAISRQGLPPANPFYGAGRGLLGYYYLWHVTAGAAARLLGVGGWAAEAGMTAFTAYASLLLVCGLVLRWGGGLAALVAAPLLLLAGSLRPLIDALAGRDGGGTLPGSADLLGWLNQAAWVPQHLASACCLVLGIVLLEQLAAGGGIPVALALGCVVAAGFGASAWIGGISFAVAGGGTALWLLARCQQRGRMLLLCALAGGIAAALAWPVASAEVAALHARGAGGGMALGIYPWLAGAPGAVRALGLPLFIAAMFPALLTAAGAWRRDAVMLAALLCLAVTALLHSTIANNDLGWRAVLPAVLVAGAAAACATRRRSWAALAIIGALLGLPDTVRMARDYVAGADGHDDGAFAAQARIWHGVQQATRLDERVGNNTLALAAATPWPVNIGWALLADRNTCFAGWASVVAYGTMRHGTLGPAQDSFDRVFSGAPRAGDMQRLLGMGCDAWLVTAQDGAWKSDPFAASCTLAARGEDWRLYRCEGKEGVLF